MRIAIVIGLTILALGIRLALSLSGSIWADEALVVNIIRIPSWLAMVDFIAWHESHPPLFYLLTRAWATLFGGALSGELMLTSVIGAIVVPATYWSARVMASARVALVAAMLAAFSPSLAEQASQLRPYGLLPVLSVLSVATLFQSLRFGYRKHWGAYVVTTTLMVYTHHWGWLIVGGHILAVVWTLSVLEPELRLRVARQCAIAFAFIALAYAFWLNPFLFQIAHTGHLGLQLATGDLVGYYLVSVLRLPNMFWAMSAQNMFACMLIGSAAGMAFAVIGPRMPAVRKAFREETSHSKNTASSAAFLLFCGLTPVTIAVTLSPTSNLLLDRCLAAVVPILLIFAAIVILRVSLSILEVGLAVVAFLLVAGLVNIIGLTKTQRSNARAIAAIVTHEKRPDDVLIVVPEWIAPSFNFYFPASIPQMDFPHPGRSNLLDFAQYREKVLDSAAFKRVSSIAQVAAETGQRVWLVTDRRFQKQVDLMLPTLSPPNRAKAISAMELDGVLSRLANRLGPPDTTHKPVRSRVERYEQLVLLLFDRRLLVRGN